MLRLKIFDIYWVFLFLFLSIFGALGYVTHINTKTKNNFAILRTVENLKLINSEFDTLLDKKLQKLDSVSVQAKLDKLNQKMHFLMQEDMHNKSDDISPKFEKVSRSFENKIALLKEFNTHNNALVDIFDELYVRQSKINTRYYFSAISQIANAMVIDFTKATYTEFDFLATFHTKIETFKNLIEVNKLVDSELIIFLEYAIDASNHLKDINTIVMENRKNRLENDLNDFYEALVMFFENSIQKERVVSYILFLMIFCSLVALVITYRIDKRNKYALIRFKKAVENSDNSIVITDKKRMIIYVNEAFEKISGYEAKDILGKKPNLLKSGMTKEEIYQDMNQKLSNGQKWEGTLINKKKSGLIYYEKASIVPLFFNDQLEGFLAIKLDITDIMESKNKIEFFAYYDQLTGLPNRIKLQEVLFDMIKVARKNQTRIAMVIADLDRFKDINDALGHPTGDKLLSTVALRLKNITQNKAFLARAGGDEFVILMECVDSDAAIIDMSLMVIDNIKKPIAIDNYMLSINASLGISLYPDDARNVLDMVKNADSAMYEAKSKGGDKYQFFTAALVEKTQKRLAYENAMRYALRRGEFSLVFQPQYSLKTKKIIGAEALVRWNSKDFGQVSPSIFIPIAEESGMIIPLGEWIFVEACKTFVDWKKHGIEIETIAINLSSIQFRQENLIITLQGIVEKTGIDAHCIEIEITEGYIMESTEKNIKILEELVKMGFKISIDDFGTGYSSMGYLKMLPLDTLKIDKSFIDNIPQDYNNVAITQAILALAKSLNFNVVAEGIENQEQEDFLRLNGCNMGQGFLFAKPMDSTSFLSFARQN